jgi:ABC-type transporter Mla subunit MlaD
VGRDAGWGLYDPRMGIEDLLGGRDLGDVKKAVGFVTENSDDFQKVLNLVRGLPDDALGLIGKLPELLKTIGSGLAEAGEQAAKAAGALVGEDGEGGARKALAGSAGTMNAAKDKLHDAAGMLAGLAGELDKIPGIGDAAAKKLNDGSGQIGGVATEVEALAGNLQDLSGILATVGEALNGLGTKLTESGGSVKTLLG